MLNNLFDDLNRKMDGAIEHLGKEFGGVRTGRASVALLDGIKVDYYGTETPLNQVASVSTPDSLTIAIQPWEAKMIPVIEKAILTSGLGLNPANDGKVVRINMPSLTEERRKELTKVVRKISEESKVALRNLRREGLEKVKKLEKDKAVSEDDAHKAGEKIQKIVDDHIGSVDKKTAAKEKEIMDR
ncbi:MAG: ribosome recycling factor [Nitrospinae bacterium]|nr:ribosome recycling factor [Nitrospinota bacterium]